MSSSVTFRQLRYGLLRFVELGWVLLSQSRHGAFRLDGLGCGSISQLSRVESLFVETCYVASVGSSCVLVRFVPLCQFSWDTMCCVELCYVSWVSLCPVEV